MLKIELAHVSKHLKEVFQRSCLLVWKILSSDHVQTAAGAGTLWQGCLVQSGTWVSLPL